MTRLALLAGLAAASLALPGAPAAAQESALIVASPIPAEAEKRFCYYEGRAYSRQAYITVGAQSAQRLSNENRLLQCVRDDASGDLVWAVRNQVQAVPLQGGSN